MLSSPSLKSREKSKSHAIARATLSHRSGQWAAPAFSPFTAPINPHPLAISLFHLPSSLTHSILLEVLSFFLLFSSSFSSSWSRGHEVVFAAMTHASASRQWEAFEWRHGSLALSLVELGGRTEGMGEEVLRMRMQDVVLSAMMAMSARVPSFLARFCCDPVIFSCFVYFSIVDRSSLLTEGHRW
jgi:hypothetical protein